MFLSFRLLQGLGERPGLCKYYVSLYAIFFHRGGRRSESGSSRRHHRRSVLQSGAGERRWAARRTIGTAGGLRRAAESLLSCLVWSFRKPRMFT